AGEVRNPQRDIPFALIVQIAIVGTIYSAVQLVAIGTIPHLRAPPPPLADGAPMMMGPVRGLLPAVGRARFGPRHQQQHGPGRPALPLRAGRVGPAPGRFRARPSEVLHALRRDPDPDGGRAGADADRNRGGARGAVGYRPPRDVHGDRRVGPGPPPQDAADPAHDPPARRAGDPDPR